LGGALVDNDRGWLVGAGSTILQTLDGGETWHAASLAAAPDIRFNAASFVDNRLGWAVGALLAIARFGVKLWYVKYSDALAVAFDFAVARSA